MLSKWQLGIVSGSVILVLVLYFAFPIVSKSKGKEESQETILAAVMTPDRLIREGKESMDSSFLPAIEALEDQIEKTEDSLDMSGYLKELSSKWFSLEQPAIAGYYAARVADIEKSAEAWSIAGTTYTYCIQKTNSEDIRSYCAEQAQVALNKAIDLEPEELRHQINFAVALVESPPADNPMAGILKLRELEAQNPDNPSVLYNLGRFAVKTGQYDKAIERLEKALSLDSNSDVIACMLSQAYRGAGKNKEADTMGQRCR